MNVHCTITISEIDGQLSISADIPTVAEKTVAGALAKQLVDIAAATMNATLGENKRPVKFTRQ